MFKGGLIYKYATSKSNSNDQSRTAVSVIGPSSRINPGSSRIDQGSSRMNLGSSRINSDFQIRARPTGGSVLAAERRETQNGLNLQFSSGLTQSGIWTSTRSEAELRNSPETENEETEVSWRKVLNSQKTVFH